MRIIILSILNLLCIAAMLPAYAGGFIIVMPDKHSNPIAPVVGQVNSVLFPLETRSTKVDVRITGQSATTSIDQTFFNPSSRQLEGYFLFPVPKDVIIDKFTMFINGKEMEAELLDAKKARGIYEEIVRRSQDPALLEYSSRGMFRVRIFPILAQSEQRIKLTYTETLNKDNGTIVYEFPLNTQKYSAKPIQHISFKINVEGTNKIKTIYCPTHETEIIRKGDKQAVVGYEASNLRSDRDFQLYYNMTEDKVGLSMLSYQDKGEDGYFFLNLSPGFGEKEKVSSKDIVFVMDKSGSMSGEKLDQAKKALKFCVNNLNEGDRFEIVPFSTEASALFGKVQDFNKGNLKEAISFIEDIRAVGGTNIDEALELALAAQQKDKNRPFFIIFMTDGKPTIGETQEASLLKKVQDKNSENVRIFTFGIGSDLNTHLLDKITESTNAHRTYVLEDEDIEVKVSNFFTKASSPVLTDIKISFDRNIRVEEMYPKAFPDLFKGSNVSVMGRFKGEGKGKITVTGQVNGKMETFVYEVDFEKNNTSHKFIPNLWASRAVGYLLDQIRLHGESKELVEEVVRLAKKHGIITPYTSYLILEDEAINPIANNNPVLRSRALNVPRIEEAFKDDVDVIRKAERAGENSVRTSKENQFMSNAITMDEAEQGRDRLNYKNDAGQELNLAQDIVQVRGRAMYFNNNEWMDANLAIEDTNNLKTNRIKFNSKAYFELIQKEEATEFLALGRNVRFVMNNEVYEIYEM